MVMLDIAHGLVLRESKRTSFSLAAREKHKGLLCYG